MPNIQSCLNYTGGKYRLLNQLLPHFPNNIDTFVDLFTGGANVAINVHANQIRCYDKIDEIIELFNYIKDIDVDELIISLNNIIDSFNLSSSSNNGYEFYNCNTASGLSSYNKEAYLRLRKAYNDNSFESTEEKLLYFYTLIIFGFNNQIRFNKSGKFNIPVGKRDFNSKLQDKLRDFSQRIQSLNITFNSCDFRAANLRELGPNDLVYADPPYLVTTASYNEQGGWTENDEIDLLNLLDELNANGVRFALSNVLEHKGKVNTILVEWANQYTIHYLNFNYNNSNYQVKDKTLKTVEVVITNY